MSPAGRAVGDRGTAVVIGGGLAGCLAAWALRGVAERVVVVERDRYPDGVDFRAGVPQARHGHLLMEAGHRTVDELLPGAVADLLAAGAHRVAVPGGLRWHTSVGRLAQFESDLAMLSCSRPLLDHVVLERVRAEPSIEILEGTEAVGLLGGRRGITGVRIRERGRDGAPVTDLPAELVVDAAGRGTRSGRWLIDLGFRTTPVERVDAGVAYASRFYHRPPGRADQVALYVQSHAPEHGRFGVLLPVEGDRWIIGIGGMRGFEPSIQPEEFEKQLGQLRDPAIAEAIAGAEPVGPARGFVPGPSLRRHHERIDPPGFLALGDASCTFNPVYGQGITVAALGARALRDAARRHGGLGPAAVREARRAITAATKDPWMMAAGEDVRFAGTTGGPRGPVVRLQHRFLDRVLTRAATDATVSAAFHRVTSLVEPPSTLFRPSVLGPVLFGG
ncbi:NAD(P)/FAD-dependent oxidoreductase [Kitasatospora cheerisanensis]|uniref:NAD(P)/FAD-dependent oxidoreductase n=1 Tax=Kitasatospora cheerisanensis TaxID=81942 RepID=UPI000691C43D|nr:FAD-dependent oxidoreductase [Kitasatospora cheerisanensis]